MIVSTREQFLTELRELLPYKSVGAEIGVLNGDFSKMIFDILKPKQLFLIDPFGICVDTYGKELNYLSTAYSTTADYFGVLNRFEKEIVIKSIVVDNNFSHRSVVNYQDNSLNFIYIDASHKYEDVKRDLRDWLPKVKADGIIAGHDFINFEGFGVVQAVSEFIIEHNFEMIIFNENGGDYALKKI